MPIEDLITTVTEMKQRYPNKPINAFDEYMSVSRIIRLPNIQGNTDVDIRAIEAIGKLAEAGHYKLLKRKYCAISEELGTIKTFHG